jgi:hypothetical protein
MTRSPCQKASTPEANDKDDDPSVYEWTAAELKENFRAAVGNTSWAALAHRKKTYVPVGYLTPSAEKVMNWALRYLDDDQYQAVVLYAMQSRFRRDGTSMAEFVRSMGWDEPMSTFRRRHKRAIEHIQVCLRRDRIPRFSLPLKKSS